MICPSFTFSATGEVVALTGATPVFVDVDETTFNIDVDSLKRGIAAAKNSGLKPKAMIPVDLFGQSADHDAIAESPTLKACSFWMMPRRGLAHATRAAARHFGLATATSFFPAKPLGCYGDGGAIFTDDAELAEDFAQCARARPGIGQIRQRPLGLTGRLDTMQAAVLIEKLKIFQDEIAARNAVAERYARGLGNAVIVPRLAAGCTSVWAQYTIRLPNGGDREALPRR